MIVTMRREKPTWGARKLRERLLRKLPNDVRVPACSTIHAIMDRHGLVTRQRHSRTKTEGTPLSERTAPNALWCTDYKGEFMLGDKRYCYPLTVSDHASRYLLLCEAMESIKEQGAFTAFERLFKERGLPDAIRSDNGVPFASRRDRARIYQLDERQDDCQGVWSQGSDCSLPACSCLWPVREETAEHTGGARKDHRESWGCGSQFGSGSCSRTSLRKN